jgi:hypothetical protein
MYQGEGHDMRLATVLIPQRLPRRLIMGSILLNNVLAHPATFFLLHLIWYWLQLGFPAVVYLCLVHH